jgi:hypothetical protein
MAEILVKTPITTNGRDPLIGADGKLVYKETILNASAKATLERINTKLPGSLKKIITDVKPEAVNPAKTANNETGK